MCLVLGYVARCLENFLCDQSFWLDPELLSDLEINVAVNEEHLATLYLGLLLQEGQQPDYAKVILWMLGCLILLFQFTSPTPINTKIPV